MYAPAAAAAEAAAHNAEEEGGRVEPSDEGLDPAGGAGPDQVACSPRSRPQTPPAGPGPGRAGAGSCAGAASGALRAPEQCKTLSVLLEQPLWTL